VNWEQELTRCGCCGGIEQLTPEALYNRPGLQELVYRIGRHSSFKESMLAQLSTLPRLRALTTRQDDDLGIATLDAWAVVLDILTFYQERIVNEGYLRTADERRSLLELARLIGYELAPGVAASTYLAFVLDDKEGSPTEITIPQGTQAQSIPGQEELPQTYETAEDLLARPQWSEFRPRLSHTQTFHDETRVFYVAGISTQLDQGDPLLLVSSMGPQHCRPASRLPTRLWRHSAMTRSRSRARTSTRNSSARLGRRACSAPIRRYRAGRRLRLAPTSPRIARFPRAPKPATDFTHYGQAHPPSGTTRRAGQA
jgi:hypothetical protein